MIRDIIYLVIGSSHGRMAQLVEPTGTFSRMRDVDVNRLLASRSLESTEGSPKNPNILGEIVRIVRIRSHGSVGSPFCTDYINSVLPVPAKLPLLMGCADCTKIGSKIWSHGSVGRAHRSHRWGHRFESCCDHHKNPCKSRVLSFCPYPNTQTSPKRYPIIPILWSGC